VALGGYLLVWVAISAAAGGLSGHRLADGTSHPGDLEVIRLLWGLPDVSDQVIRPWLRTVPLLTCGLLAGVAYAGWEALSARRAGSEARAALVGVLIVLLLAVGAVPTDRIETRYTFFLYPLMLLLATTAVIHLARRSALLRRLPPAAAAAVPLLCFGASGDFQPGHVIAIDSARVNYRTGLPAHLAEHYYPRNDIRGVADYLAAHVHAGDVVITGIPSLDEYYRPIDYFFLADGDERYETFVCQDGRTERWTNRPVLYTAAALRPIVAGHRVFASVFADTERRLAADGPAQGWSVNRVWRADSGTADVILIQAAPAAGGLP
jgi:hypothetical protein